MLSTRHLRLILSLLMGSSAIAAPLPQALEDASRLCGFSGSCSASSSRIPLQRRVINEASLEDGDPSKLDASEAKPRMNDRTLSRLRCFIPYGITPGANVGLGHALSQKFPDQIRPAAPAPVVRMSCPCCEEPEDVNNMLFCPKDHALCKECVRVLGDLKLSKGATQLLCEESRCKTAFPDKLLFRLLNNSQLKLLNKNRALKEIKESGIKAILRECPVCETPFWQAKGDELLTKMHCGACGTTSCIPCAAYHKGMDCAEYMDYKQRQSSQSEKHAINEAMSQALVRSCPGCKRQFIKENNGCNLMHCPDPGCLALSCYVCKQAIGGYSHFGDPPNCPMYYKLTTQAQHEEEVRAAAEAEALKRSNTNKDSVD